MMYANKLERHYKDMQDMEFTIEHGKLFFLQTRNGKRTANAALKIAVDMVNEGKISKEEALLRVDEKQIDQLLHPTFDKSRLSSKQVIADGLAASPGAATGKIYFTAGKIEEAYKNGERVTAVSSGKGWRWTEGPVVFQNWYGGEDYDATKEIQDWNMPRGGRNGWKPAVIMASPKGRLIGREFLPIKIMEKIPAKSGCAKIFTANTSF